MKDYNSFRMAIRKRESSDNYKAVNSFGFLGAYQFGRPRLWDMGYSIDGWKPSWWSLKRLKSYKVSVISKEQFLNDKDLQDEIFSKHVRDLQRRIRQKYSRQYNKYRFGITITESGLVAGAHLKGMGGLKEFFEGRDNQDGYGTKISEYIEKFGGYSLDANTL